VGQFHTDPPLLDVSIQHGGDEGDGFVEFGVVIEHVNEAAVVEFRDRRFEDGHDVFEGDVGMGLTDGQEQAFQLENPVDGVRHSEPPAPGFYTCRDCKQAACAHLESDEWSYLSCLYQRWKRAFNAVSLANVSGEPVIRTVDDSHFR